MKLVEGSFGPGFAAAFRMAHRDSADDLGLAVDGPIADYDLRAVFSGDCFLATFDFAARFSARFAAVFGALECWRLLFPSFDIFAD